MVSINRQFGKTVPAFPNRFSEFRYRVGYAANHSHTGDCNWRESIGH
jgi:hypothetical protein